MTYEVNALQAVQSFCRRSNIPEPTTLLALTDPGHLQLRELLYEVSEELRALRCWPQQKKTWTISLAGGSSVYTLPSDFYSAVPRTGFDTVNGRALRVLGDAEFAEEAALVHYDHTTGYRIFGIGQSFQVSPTPTSSGTITFEYITKNLFTPPFWSAGETGIAVNTYRSASGNIYRASAVTTGVTNSARPSHTSGTVLHGGVTWEYYEHPYEIVVADSDLLLFDKDLVVLGLKAKWPTEKGLVRERAQVEYEKRISQARGRLTGIQTGTFTRGAWGPHYYVEDGSWNI
jgi:hypothetical protein